jgi:hypothetical protein
MSDWKVGQSVQHPKLGEGRVAERDLDIGSNKGFVRVDFEQSGATRSRWADEGRHKKDGWS